MNSKPLGVTKDADEIITIISKQVGIAQKAIEDAESLSKAIDTLGTYNWALGQWLAVYEELEDSMKAELEEDKAKIVDELVEADYPVNKAEVKATLKLRDKTKEHRKIKSMVNRLKRCRQSTESKIDTGRSRLARISNDIRNETGVSV